MQTECVLCKLCRLVTSGEIMQPNTMYVNSKTYGRDKMVFQTFSSILNQVTPEVESILTKGS